jgi:hypothetical protein
VIAPGMGRRACRPRRRRRRRRQCTRCRGALPEHVGNLQPRARRPPPARSPPRASQQLAASQHESRACCHRAGVCFGPVARARGAWNSLAP